LKLQCLRIKYLKGNCRFCLGIIIENNCYCFSCRIKRIEQKDELETEKTQEYRDMEAMQDDNNRMKDEVEALYAKYEALKKFAALKKIPIPPELESIN